jgi:SAM-dependent methyltransferase
MRSFVIERIGKLPVLGTLVRRTARWLHRNRPGSFQTSGSYWDNRYVAGGNSGRGSYGELAEYKAQVINTFVLKHDLQSVIEFGCGDGNQLGLARYRSYVGYDISPAAIALCRERCAGDATKRFAHMKDYSGEAADLSLSLDVIYHLVEYGVFEDYMKRLFQSAQRFVIIYSSNYDSPSVPQAPHVRHRRFTSWIEEHCNDWRLIEHVKNPYPFNPDQDSGSFADFFIFEREVTGPIGR